MDYRSFRFNYGSYEFDYKHTMKGEDAYGLLEDSVKLLTNAGYNVQLIADNMREAGQAEHYPDNTFIHKIGTAEIVANPDKVFTMDKALAPLVACFHEICGHEWQWELESQKLSPLSTTLIMSDLACKVSYDYYGLDKNMRPTKRYFSQLHELAAQYRVSSRLQNSLATPTARNRLKT